LDLAYDLGGTTLRNQSLIIDRPAVNKGPRRVNVGRQESGHSGKESAPAATTAAATVAKIKRASRQAGNISWGG
jgi:hypothetical protein